MAADAHEVWAAATGHDGGDRDWDEVDIWATQIAEDLTDTETLG